MRTKLRLSPEKLRTVIGVLDGLIEKKERTAVTGSVEVIRDGKGCKHNRWHDEDGKLSSKEDAVVSSIRKKTSKDCKPGTTRANPHRWIKNPDKCGREGPYRCKDDTKKSVREQVETNAKDFVEILGAMIKDRPDLLDEILEFVAASIRAVSNEEEYEPFDEPSDSEDVQINELDREKLKSMCKRINLLDFPSFVRILNTLNVASKGDLYKQQKKKK